MRPSTSFSKMDFQNTGYKETGLHRHRMSENGKWHKSWGLKGSSMSDKVQLQLRQEESCVLLDPFLIWWIFHTGCKETGLHIQHEWHSGAAAAEARGMEVERQLGKMAQPELSPNLFSHNVAARHFVLWTLQFASHILHFALGKMAQPQILTKPLLTQYCSKHFPYICVNCVYLCVYVCIFEYIWVHWDSAARTSPNLISRNSATRRFAMSHV